MPYRIARHGDELIWVVMEGELTLAQAEAYFCELWGLLDACAGPTDLLVDGRRIAGVSPSARRRTEQVAHHPRLGHLAFVVREQHLLVFAPLMKLVSGIGLFGSEDEALDYLRGAHGLPAVIGLQLPIPAPEPQAGDVIPEPPPPAPLARAVGDPRPTPPPPAPRAASAPWPARPALPRSTQTRFRRPPEPGAVVLNALTEIVDGWTNNLRSFARRIERD